MQFKLCDLYHLTVTCLASATAPLESKSSENKLILMNNAEMVIELMSEGKSALQNSLAGAWVTHMDHRASRNERTWADDG